MIRFENQDLLHIASTGEKKETGNRDRIR